MKIIVDNNQISEMRKPLRQIQKRQITVVLPPFVWAEALLVDQDYVRCLLEYNLRFGKNVSEVLREAAIATSAQLRMIDPLVRKRSPAHRACVSDLRTCPAERRARAVEINQGNRLDGVRIRAAFADPERPQLSRNIPSLDAAIAELGPFLDAQYTADNDQSAAAPTWRKLLNSRNTGLANFGKYHICLVVSYQQSWQNKRLNAAPPEKRDQVPDMSLPLYAKDEDIIVTNDQQFAKLFRVVDPTNRIRVITWAECVKNAL